MLNSKGSPSNTRYNLKIVTQAEAFNTINAPKQDKMLIKRRCPAPKRDLLALQFYFNMKKLVDSITTGMS